MWQYITIVRGEDGALRSSKSYRGLDSAFLGGRTKQGDREGWSFEVLRDETPLVGHHMRWQPEYLCKWDFDADLLPEDVTDLLYSLPECAESQRPPRQQSSLYGSQTDPDVCPTCGRPKDKEDGEENG